MSKPKTLSVDKYGIKNANVRYQLSADELHQETLDKKLGVEASSGAIAINTGEFTGRSPKDRFIVKDDITKDRVWWGNINIPFEPEKFDKLYEKVVAYLSSKEIYVHDGYVCADPKYRTNIRTITELPWSNLFAFNMFLRVEDSELKIMKRIYPEVAPYLTDEGRAAIEAQGVYVKGDDGEWETEAVFAAAAPLVLAQIGGGGDELLNQPAVCAVDFHAVQACVECEFGSAGEVLHHLRHFVAAHFAHAPVSAGGDGAESARHQRIGAAACVGDLGDDFRALFVRNGCVFAQGGQVACVKSVGRRKTDAGRMHIGKRHHKQPEAAKKVAPEITGGVGQPAVGIRFVNRQRRDDKAVFDCHAVLRIFLYIPQ